MKTIFKRFGFVDYALLAMLAIAILLAVLRLRGIAPVSEWTIGMMFFVLLCVFLRNHVRIGRPNEDEQLAQGYREMAQYMGKSADDFEKIQGQDLPRDEE